MIEAFNCIKDIEDVNSELFFPLAINTAQCTYVVMILFFFKSVLNLMYERTSSVKGLSMTGIYCQKL